MSGKWLFAVQAMRVLPTLALVIAVTTCSSSGQSTDGSVPLLGDAAAAIDAPTTFAIPGDASAVDESVPYDVPAIEANHCAMISDCQPPPSICGHPNTLVYYLVVGCQDGLCQFAERTMACACRNNGCRITPTL